MPSSLDEYEVLCTIGTGSYGTCKKIRRKKDGKVRYHSHHLTHLSIFSVTIFYSFILIIKTLNVTIIGLMEDSFPTSSQVLRNQKSDLC